MEIIFIGMAVFALIGLFLIFYFIGIYNSLVRKRNEYQNSFKQIDVQLKRRYDLIPNLVETAKKFMSHERETLEAVIMARNQAAGAMKALGGNAGNIEGMKNSMQMEGMLSQTLGKLFAVSESYPEIKSDSTMSDLMEELKSTENKISFARQHYNDSVTDYNNTREVFPSNIIAGMFNFIAATLWEITNNVEREAVKVEF
ncbi:LemA family protein [Halobacteriovorax sp. HLS]|uniref:LemA family protein n=1 Tax=Halobacteriovorax sp. HLS TaxID=2234000 RepID=UPI000FDB8A35|nr:LemA family protein [Halobacteriovorax sp. HLS]